MKIYEASAHWFPPGRSQYLPPALPWAGWRLWWPTAGHLSQSTLLAASRAGLHLPSFLYSSYLGLWSAWSGGCQGCQKAWEGAGREGRVGPAEAFLLTQWRVPFLLCFWVTGGSPTEVSQQLRGPREAGPREKLSEGLYGEIHKTQRCLHLHLVLSILLTASCLDAPAYHHEDGQIKTTCWYLAKFIHKAAVLFFPLSYVSSSQINPSINITIFKVQMRHFF